MGFLSNEAEHDAGGQRLRVPPGVVSEAKYAGPNNCYRLTLTRVWNAQRLLSGPLKMLLWIMLNPSVATEHTDDRTLAKAARASAQWGYDGMTIANVFPLRLTDSKLLHKAAVPLTIGKNLDEIARLIQDHRYFGPVMVGWGAPPHAAVRVALYGEVARIKRLLRGRGRAPGGLTIDGHPKHPLYPSLPPRMEECVRWPAPKREPLAAFRRWPL